MSKTLQRLGAIALLLFLLPNIHAAVAPTVADSLGQVLNAQSPACDADCAYYAGEHSSIGLSNTFFTILLIAFGSAWFFYTYKKKIIIIVGSLLSLTVLGTYLYPEMIREKEIPANCPAAQHLGKTSANTTDFLPPTNDEFATTLSGEKNTATPKTSSLDKVLPKTATAVTIADEFQSTDGEFTSSENILPNTKTSFSDYLRKPQVYEPLIIFLLIAFISLMIQYPAFRKTRGLFLLGALFYLGFYRGACPCMISSFEDLPLMLLGVPIRWEALLWFLLLLPATYFFGKIWCGWLCHLGALQEFLYHTPKMKILTTNKAQKTLKIIQITVFVVWILQLIITRSNLFCEYDPFKVAFNLISANTIGYVLLAVLLISSVLIYRPFCRTTCPVGLLLGWVSYLPGARKLYKDEACIHCKSCDKACKPRAMVHENKRTTLRSEDCILCGECLSECKINAIDVKWKQKKQA
jgi:ferredoxin